MNLYAGTILGNNLINKYSIDILINKNVIIISGVEILFAYKKISSGVIANYIAISPLLVLRSCFKAKIVPIVSTMKLVISAKIGKSVKFITTVDRKEFNINSII